MTGPFPLLWLGVQCSSNMAHCGCGVFSPLHSELPSISSFSFFFAPNRPLPGLDDTLPVLITHALSTTAPFPISSLVTVRLPQQIPFSM